MRIVDKRLFGAGFDFRGMAEGRSVILRNPFDRLQTQEISGPGTELKKLLAGWPFRITASPDCSCNQIAAQMDAWGPDECERAERIEYILAAMRENAEKRGLPFFDAAGRFLIRRAIKNARKSHIDP
jgi:hypothetical protein